MDKKIIKYIPAITMLPAISIGALVMYIDNAPTFIYLQGLLCFAVLEIICFVMVKSKLEFRNTKPLVFIVVSTLALLISLLNLGVGGVYRWIAIGPLQLYVSAIVLPIIIINLWSLLKEDRVIAAVISIMCVSLILTIQPDASMMTAFGVTSLILLWNKINKLSAFILTVFLGGLSVFTWTFLDGLEAVPYVEGIFKMVMDIGILGSILGAISLIIMIIPFLFFQPSKNKILSISFGIYYIIILISNIFGNFPVPLMGYGISPIVGYFISIVWYTNLKLNDNNNEINYFEELN